MSAIDVHAGDFCSEQSHDYYPGHFAMTIKIGGEFEKILACEVMETEVVSQGTDKNFVGSLLCGVFAGLFLLFLQMYLVTFSSMSLPLDVWILVIGLGLLGGGWKTRVTFTLKFKDGRRMLATAKRVTYVQILTDSWGS